MRRRDREVTDEKTMDAWKQISAECIRRIRVIAPKTKIMIGGYWNNSVTAVKDLPMPADENIVYNFHYKCWLYFLQK